ncbi:hypothetical protein C8E87_3220 [Paractinoplanes brasiliensis]|uniref:Uncharacterized protein n=1 Tax=Paractinoplanes brasiliensis TaxID=52695 RepID=A0A4R6JSS3_9ACTN|nr:hypothetical protein C8E87_3220 [Actinoplanes brasiliensis]
MLDTGPLTTDVIGSVKRGEPSPLCLAMQAGLVRGYAAHHVWAEVPRVLAKRAGQARVSFEELERLWWDEYVPLIRVVDCAGLPTTRQSRVLAGRDDSDTNTLLLAGLIAPVVVIAEDRDIVSSGLAYEQWTHFYEVARAIDAGKRHLTSAALLASLGGHGAAAAGRGVVRLMASPVGKGAVALTMLALAVAAVRWGPDLRASWRRGDASRKELMTEFGVHVTAFLQRLERAEGVWKDAERGEPGTSVTHRVATVLASAEAPMTRTELVAALDMTDFRRGMDQLGHVLFAAPAFVQVTGYRWQLGRDGVDFGLSAGRVRQG